MKMAYIARHSCGKVVAATVDRPDMRRQVARETAKWIRLGDSVERMSVEKAKRIEWCECWRSQKTGKATGG